MKKEEFLGRSYQILLIVVALLIMLISFDLKFIIISFIFFGFAGGLFEAITLQNFYAKEKKFKKNNIKEGIKYGLLWVHFNIHCIKKYGTKLYYFEKLGSLPTFIAYFIMVLYTLIALILYKNYSYFGLAIYLIPIATNIYSFLKNNYLILKK